MWKVTGILVVSIIIIYVEGPALKKKKRIKEMAVFYFLLMMGASTYIAKSRQMKLPDPVHLMESVYQPVSKVVFHFLQ
ncbi:hypothetical protein M1K46_24210 [Fictibacillus sp. WQ 8-8]|uniref:hypothetical protein n=1 Tax=Fictibacillus sp. WQ 8-8 TaxID=2938788 RepID=UPI00210D3D71|nr:hypothetical protein [Fictibacillus sp. WQ 8-8]MCQ6268681.1 hypothetical protein [Fictibacillus sp. WQ 8-8]